MADATPPTGEPAVLSRQIMAMLGNTTVVLLLLTVAYFTVPLRIRGGEASGFLRLGTSLLLFGAAGWLLGVHWRRSRRRLARDFYRIQQLLSALYLLVLVFGLSYAMTSTWLPDQIDGVRDRTDALYFSVTVISTVGFGDIHASGSFARMLVTVQMLFNLIYLGTALRVLSAVRVPAQAPRSPDDQR